MVPKWPEGLPAPLKSVSARPVSPIVRSKMVSGRTFVRRNFTAVPVIYRMTWLFDSEQAATFEDFFKNDLEDGTRWFEMMLRVPQGEGPWLFRFVDIYEGGDMVGVPSSPLWQYSASLEMFRRPERVILTSGLYPMGFRDAIAPRLVEPSSDRRTVLHDYSLGPESLGVGLLPPAISRRSIYLEYDSGKTESISIGLLPPAISRKSSDPEYYYNESIGVGLLPPAISRKTVYHEYRGTDQLSIGLVPPVIFREKVADYIEYEIPEESISVGLLAPTIKRTNA